MDTLSETMNMKYNSDNCSTWGDLVALSEKEEIQDHIRRAYTQLGSTHDINDKTPLADISVKDELCLMDIATFTLTKQPDLENLTLEYELKDAKVTVSGLPQRGIATVYDYDIVLYIVSHLAKEMNKVKRIINDAEEKKKKNPRSKVIVNPKLPSRFFEPDIDTLLEFCGRPAGGLQYDAIHQSLLRLQGTSVAIEKLTTDGYRRAGAFSYINGFDIIARTDKGIVRKVKIEIPSWIYDGIVRIETPTVLSLNREYFDLTEGIQRFLHRYARKIAGFGGTIKVSVKELHEKSGSKRELKFFTQDLKKSLANLKKQPISDFSISYFSEGRGKNFVIFQKLQHDIIGLPLPRTTSPIELTNELRAEAMAIAPNYDPKWLFDSWTTSTSKKIGWDKIKDPRKAFLSFCKKNHDRNPTP